MAEFNVDVQDRALALVKAPAEGRTLSGYAIKWDSFTNIGGVFMERFAPGAWGDSAPKVIHEHGMDPSFGLKPIAVLRSLADDGSGMAYEAELLDAPYVEPLLPGLRAGLFGASFRFRALDQTINRRPGKSDHNPEGLPEITVVRAQVTEISTTTFPAYADSTASVRSTDITPQDEPAPPAEKEESRTAAPPQERDRANMTLEQLIAELEAKRSRLAELDTEHQNRSMDATAQTEWDTLSTEVDAIVPQIAAIQARSARLTELAGVDTNTEHYRAAPNTRRAGVATGDDIWDLSTVRSNGFGEGSSRDLQDRAIRAIEASTFNVRGISNEDVQANVASLLESDEGGEIATRILTTGSPLYRSAFRKTLLGRPLDSDEIRAMSLTGANGGFATLPYQFDPTIIKTGALAINPLREISRSVQISGTNTWKGVSSGAVVASFDAEASVVSDDSPTLAQPSITCYPARAFVPYSFELGEDYPGLIGDLGGLIAEAKDTLEANKFTVGTGTGEPFGIITRATTTVTAGGTAAFARADLDALDNALPARYQANAKLMANRVQANRIRSLDTTSGNVLWGPQAQLSNGIGVSKLLAAKVLGYDLYQNTDMSAVLTTGAKIMVEGDFQQYVIVDRIGMQVELVSNLFDPTTGRPTGQRGILAHWRVGADVTNALAFRTLVTG